MKKDTYEKELKKDINIIKKDLRAISIKTRLIARELEETKPTIKTPKSNKSSWIGNLILKVKGWFTRNKSV
tara:strand:+ start:200 stop:412 length:213 start_codon:yes stop_codon:yes gene_type:complete